VQSALADTGGHIVWLDYRNRSWDVFAVRFDGVPVAGVRIDGVPSSDERERLHGEPRVAASGTRVVAAWSDLRERRGHADIAFVVSDDGGLSWSERRIVPGGVDGALPRSSGGSAMPRYRPDVVIGSSGAELVFQDLAPRKSAIFHALIAPAGVASAPSRLDDTDDSDATLTRPRAAKLGSATLVVWEDDRDGAYQIFAARH
jgi:hypothetical protein